MLTRVLLLTSGFVLIACWIGTLYDTYNSTTHIVVNTDTLFLSLSILLASWVHALSRPSQEPADRLPADYIQFISKIGDRTLTREQLIEEVGESSGYVYAEDGPGKYEKQLSNEQTKSLERLIYEGKIILREEQYSLPKESA